MATGTVTLDKAYFETLLRRAEFHTSGVDFTTPLNVPTVTIPKTNHDSLLAISRQYANLKRNLYRGGIAEETLAVLIRDDSATQDEESITYDEETQQPLSSAQGNGGHDNIFGRNSNYATRNADLHSRDTNGNANGFYNHSQNMELSQTNDDYMPDGPDCFYDGGSGNNESQPKYQRPQFAKFAKRTVQLANLAESTTHQDIVDAVRGGMLLDIYLRIHDRTASVSFLDEAQAHAFFRHVKRHDLYIRGKRVEIRWNDRQFILPGHVANKIAIGATRNLVIQNCAPRHTEEAIRDDLEHIHNLIVIKVAFSDNNAYISTNSVHNSMFARTCMMSRSTYKGSKIEWDNDECAAPIERPQQYRQDNVAPKKKDAPLKNRFQLLNMDDDEEDDDHDTSVLSIPTVMTGTSVFV